MKNYIYKFLLLGIGTIALSSCDDGPDKGTSRITSFEKFPFQMTTAPQVISEEDAGTYVFKFKADDRQITDIHLVVGPGSSSTATEDVDFVIHEHEFDVPAMGGQDSVFIEIEVLEDLEVEAGDDEKLFIAFTTTAPSGVSEEEVLAITIKDSGRDGVGFDLSWEFADPVPTAAEDLEDCDNDVDFTIQPEGSAPYASDLLGNNMASAACTEHGRIAIDEMEEGEVYNVWVFFYGPGTERDLGDFDNVNIHLDFERFDSSLKGSYDIEGEFDAATEDGALKILTIEKNGDVITIKNLEGDVLSEG
jgi:hypothetical protein